MTNNVDQSDIGQMFSNLLRHPWKQASLGVGRTSFADGGFPGSILKQRFIPCDTTCIDLVDLRKIQVPSDWT
jgi:hypothetical protein